MSYLSTLSLSQFRSYETARLHDLRSGLIVLHGPNGAGKTNILEAISLLSPGRGLRSAKNEMLQRTTTAPHTHSQTGWAIAANVQHDYGSVKIGTGSEIAGGKRIVRINGQTMRGQNALAQHVACVWLTPQMDRLFLDQTAQRRKFFDRLIFAFDAGHAGRVQRYDNALAQRSKILREAQETSSQPNGAWLDALETQIAQSGCAIAAARHSFVTRLQAVCDQNNAQKNALFPHAILQLRGTLEELIGNMPSVQVEDFFKDHLRASRQRDALIGGAQSGPHKTDLCVSYAAKNMPADQCSTGEQKALLIGIILAHSVLITAERSAPPILLLDEVAAHLDEQRRSALYSLLRDLGGQVWLTGTDKNLFTGAGKTAQFFDIEKLQNQYAMA